MTWREIMENDTTIRLVKRDSPAPAWMLRIGLGLWSAIGRPKWVSFIIESPHHYVIRSAKDDTPGRLGIGRHGEGTPYINVSPKLAEADPALTRTVEGSAHGDTITFQTA